MRTLSTCIALLAALATGAVGATAQTYEDQHGVLNMQSLSLEGTLRRIEDGTATSWDCVHGYEAAKMALKHQARRILEHCARNGVPGAMSFLSQMEETGATSPCNAEMATEWDRRSAQSGYSVGLLNYGLDLLRGHGAPQDKQAGRDLVDRAAREGDRTAIELARNGYDPRSVLPDNSYVCGDPLTN